MRRPRRRFAPGPSSYQKGVSALSPRKAAATTSRGRGGRDLTRGGPATRKLQVYPDCDTSGDLSASPILLGLPLNRRPARVLTLDPMRRVTGTIAGVLPLRHDAFKAKLAGVIKDKWVIFVRRCSFRRMPTARAQDRQCLLAYIQRVVPQIIAVEFDQVERPHEDALVAGSARISPT